MYETIKCLIENKVLIIKLSRPNVLNAFNRKMLEELLLALDDAERNDTIRVIIVTGEGRAFCAGSDLSNGEDAFAGNAALNELYRDIGGILSLKIYNLNKPVIAAINGPAVGVGITMTLPMDIRIISEQAKIGFVFCRRGIGPEACSGWFLPRLVGISKACEWVLTGRMVAAHEAKEAGLCNYVVSPDILMETALKIAHEIAENTSATSIAFSRKLLWRMLGGSHPFQSHQFESQFLQWAGNQFDAKEGINSFFEKREPKFKLTVSNDLPEFFD
jgi:enoyl-CoA hydratase/carnithine racemase